MYMFSGYSTSWYDDDNSICLAFGITIAPKHTIRYTIQL